MVQYPSADEECKAGSQECPNDGCHSSSSKGSAADFFLRVSNLLGLATAKSRQEIASYLADASREATRMNINVNEVIARHVENDRQGTVGDNLGDHGVFDSFELLRRDTFNGWFVDQGLIAQVLREVVADCPPSVDPTDAELVRVLDLGAGSGAYADFMNRTGLVAAHAYDAIPDAAKLTAGRVQHLNLAWPLSKQKTPDPAAWVLCLEVAEHVPPRDGDTLVRNLGALASRALVISWAAPEKCGLGWGHLNCLPSETVAARFAQLTGLQLDEAGTARLRRSARISWIQSGVLLFRPQSPGSCNPIRQQLSSADVEMHSGPKSSERLLGAAKLHMLQVFQDLMPPVTALLY